MVKIKVRKTKENAVIPGYAHEGDAGVDLYSTEDYSIAPGKRTLVSTGIQLEIPKGYEGQVRPKSGLALKKGITVLNTPGTIDSPYRGEVGVIIINHSDETVSVDKGSKIAQMVINRVEEVEFEEGEDLEASERGEGGFGSTGLK